MDYTVVKAEDECRVQEFIHGHFMPDMPLFRTFGLDDMPPPRPSSPAKPTRDEGDFSLTAIDAHGSIVGVAMNRVSVNYVMKPDDPPQLKKMMELLEWVKQDARLDTLPERTIELRVLAVHREWRRRGVARRLAEESVRRARQSGYQAMRVCCTSDYTARLVRAMGWRQHYRLRYSDYPSRAGADVVVRPEPPHLYIYYYVVDL